MASKAAIEEVEGAAICAQVEGGNLLAKKAADTTGQSRCLVTRIPDGRMGARKRKVQVAQHLATLDHMAKTEQDESEQAEGQGEQRKDCRGGWVHRLPIIRIFAKILIVFVIGYQGCPASETGSAGNLTVQGLAARRAPGRSTTGRCHGWSQERTVALEHKDKAALEIPF